MNKGVTKQYSFSQFFSYFIVALILQISASVAYAAEEKGSASLDYGFSLSDKEKQQVIDDAKKNALERWVVKKNKSHFKNFEKVQSDINASINDYVLGHQIIDSSKKDGLYSVVIRAELNEPKIMSALLASSEQATGGEQKYLTFVFVAREQVGKVSRSGKQATQTKAKGQEIIKEREENRAAQTKKQIKQISQTKKEIKFNDKVLWNVSTTNEVNVAMGEVFTDADYLVVDAELLEEETNHLMTVENFKNDYSEGNDLSARTKRDALKGLKELADPVEYLAIGTLDVEEARTNQKTGNVSVAVTITGQVLSVFKRGAAVAKVGPETMIGEGPSPMVARNNALKNAAQQVANKLVAKLSSKNIR